MFTSVENKYALWETMKQQQGALHISVNIQDIFEKTILEVDAMDESIESKNSLFISIYLQKIQQKSREAYFEERLHHFEKVDTMDIYDEIRQLKLQIQEICQELSILKNNIP